MNYFILLSSLLLSLNSFAVGANASDVKKLLNSNSEYCILKVTSYSNSMLDTKISGTCHENDLPATLRQYDRNIKTEQVEIAILKGMWQKYELITSSRTSYKSGTNLVFESFMTFRQKPSKKESSRNYYGPGSLN